jgi:hypothetical protein
MTAAMMNERWHIQDKARVQISMVCSDDSLGPKQKADKLHQIDEQTEGEIAKIIPAKQLAEYKACQADRDQDNAQHPGKRPHLETGRCGGVIPPASSAPAHSADQHPGNPSKQ